MEKTTNQEIVTLKLQRIDICNLIIATTIIKHESQAQKWGTLHEKLKQILNDFDKKHID